MKPLGLKNYGSIPHLLGSKLGKTDKYIHEGQHRILTEKTRDKHDFIIVTEKYDGSNVGICKKDGKILALTRSGYLAETSPYKQHHVFAKWVDKQKDRFRYIEEGERICCEWLYQVYSVRYEINCDPIVAFDYFDSFNNRRPFSELAEKSILMGLENPRVLRFGYNAFSIESCKYALLDKYCHSIIAKDNPEGFVYRVERKGVFDFMAKYVRPDFEPGKYIIDKDEKNFIYNCKLDL